VKRAVALGVAVVLAAALLVVVGPARLRPWQCHDMRSAKTARAAFDAYYAACWSRPEMNVPPVDEGSVPGGAVGDGRAWHHLVEFSVRYDDGSIRFLLIGQEEPGDDWRPVQGEGSGP